MPLNQITYNKPWTLYVDFDYVVIFIYSFMQYILTREFPTWSFSTTTLLHDISPNE